MFYAPRPDSETDLKSIYLRRRYCTAFSVSSTLTSKYIQHFSHICEQFAACPGAGLTVAGSNPNLICDVSQVTSHASRHVVTFSQMASSHILLTPPPYSNLTHWLASLLPAIEAIQARLPILCDEVTVYMWV